MENNTSEMKRIIKVQDSLNERKYILKKEHKSFGIYEEKCPSGYFVHQSWLISNGNKIIVCQSFNDLCEEELLDMIDQHETSGHFGVRAFYRGNVYFVHPNGSQYI